MAQAELCRKHGAKIETLNESAFHELGAVRL